MLLFLGGKRVAGNPTGSDLVREVGHAEGRGRKKEVYIIICSTKLRRKFLRKLKKRRSKILQKIESGLDYVLKD